MVDWDDLGAGLSLRPATADDEHFLAGLYRSTRDDLASVAATPEVVDLLIAHQRQIQENAIARTYPDARHLVAEARGRPIGRVVVDLGADSLHLVEIAVLPAARRQGHGTRILGALQRQAARAGLPLTLMVGAGSAARRLYAAAGFRLAGSTPATDLMTWTPP